METVSPVAVVEDNSNTTAPTAEEISLDFVSLDDSMEEMLSEEKSTEKKEAPEENFDVDSLFDNIEEF